MMSFNDASLDDLDHRAAYQVDKILMRGMHLLPRRGDKPEWQHTQDYWTERDELPAAELDDGAFVYE